MRANGFFRSVRRLAAPLAVALVYVSSGGASGPPATPPAPDEAESPRTVAGDPAGAGVRSVPDSAAPRELIHG